MKNYSVKLLFFIFIAAAQLPVSAQVSLENLYRGRQYFDLRDALAKRSKENSPALLFYRGIVANRFNQLRKSDEFLQKYLDGNEAAHQQDAYETLADNYTRTFDYGKAADVYKLVLDRFKDKIDAEKKKDYENSFGLWDSLRNSPKQEVTFNNDLSVQGTRDKADLLNLPVEISGQKMDFVFDTGANLSTMTVSTAKKLGLKIIESSVSVNSSSDIKVNSKLAVVPSLKLGSATFRNVVFLVFDDKSLFFPQINYQINGIIGFPVMESLGNITITRKDAVSAKARIEEIEGEPNMCLEELKPLVAGIINNRKLIFTFDSGAVTSTFYPKFFEANRRQILRLAKPKKIKLGGAGGFKEVNAYFLNDLNLTIAGKTAKFAEAEIITEAVNDESRNFYGNLGQDLIKQFERMTLDFRAMKLIFE